MTAIIDYCIRRPKKKHPSIRHYFQWLWKWEAFIVDRDERMDFVRVLIYDRLLEGRKISTVCCTVACSTLSIIRWTCERWQGRIALNKKIRSVSCQLRFSAVPLQRLLYPDTLCEECLLCLCYWGIKIIGNYALHTLFFKGFDSFEKRANLHVPFFSQQLPD